MKRTVTPIAIISFLFQRQEDLDHKITHTTPRPFIYSFIKVFRYTKYCFSFPTTLSFTAFVCLSLLPSLCNPINLFRRNFSIVNVMVFSKTRLWSSACLEL